MKDFPLFTTENGAAGLTLQEIPYNKRAYITIHNTQNLPALLQECKDFCRAVGAEEIYACNHKALSRYPVYTRILAMERENSEFPKTDAVLMPITRENLTEFQEIYNRKMANVPAAKYLTTQRAQTIQQEGSCYFVYRQDVLLGIGIAANGEISAVASLQPEAGAEIVMALCKTLTADRVLLEVADENRKAICLYERLGFQTTAVKNVWYKI